MEGISSLFTVGSHMNVYMCGEISSPEKYLLLLYSNNDPAMQNNIWIWSVCYIFRLLNVNVPRYLGHKGASSVYYRWEIILPGGNWHTGDWTKITTLSCFPPPCIMIYNVWRYDPSHPVAMNLPFVTRQRQLLSVDCKKSSHSIHSQWRGSIW